MHDARPEPVIDPQLLTGTISPLTVQPSLDGPTQGAKSKKPTKAKGSRKAKSKAPPKKKQPGVIPDELPDMPIDSRP